MNYKTQKEWPNKCGLSHLTYETKLQYSRRPRQQTARFWNKGPLMQNNLFMRKIKRPYQKNLFLYCMKKYFKIGLWTVLTLWSVLLPVNYMPMWLNAEAISVKRTFTFSNNKRVFAKPDIPNSLYHMVHPCVYVWFIPGRSRETWNNPSILNC